MTRRVLSWVTVIAVVVGTTPATAGALGQAQDALRQRYLLSRIEVQNLAHEGAVVVRGAVLTLEADGVPANTFRTVRTNTKSPRFHVLDYAKVEIAEDGAVHVGRGELRPPRGTRLVVLDLKTDADGVRLFTHTADPVMGDGRPAYGCTEFVFRVGPSRLEPSDLAAIERAIERWLPFAA